MRIKRVTAILFTEVYFHQHWKADILVCLQRARAQMAQMPYAPLECAMAISLLDFLCTPIDGGLVCSETDLDPWREPDILQRAI